MMNALVLYAAVLFFHEPISVLAGTSILPTWTINSLGRTEQDSQHPYIFRDGGGGGTVNGYNIIVFSDTITPTSSGTMRAMYSNSIAYSSKTNPLQLTDFGSNGIVRQGIPNFGDETPGFVNGKRTIIWPSSAIIDLNGTGVYFLPVASITTDAKSEQLYSTICTITATETGPTVKRIVPKLFAAGETWYGVFSALLHPRDGHLYMFANTGKALQSSAGLKVARVLAKSYADKTQVSLSIFI